MLTPTGSLHPAADGATTLSQAHGFGVSQRLALAAMLLSLLLAVVLRQGLSAGHGSIARSARAGAVPVALGSHDGLWRLPLAAQGPVSATVGAAEQEYRVSASEGGLSAVSPVQRLAERFGPAGVSIGSGSLRVGLRLQALGWGSSLRSVGDVAPRARANRVVYSHPAVSEWYSNGPVGLEQGFTIARAPAGPASGPLTLAIALSSNARASLRSNDQAVSLQGPKGALLRYGGLVASDASGRTLHSWLALRAGRVLLRVDAHGARYPLRIDPFVQQGEKLTGSGEQSGIFGGGLLGASVALSADGNTALIGGPVDNGGVGAAWVFTRSGSTWSQQGEKLTAKSGEETGSGAFFGDSVALSADGDTALIGAPLDNGGVGAVWTFTRSGSTWSQLGEKLTAKSGEETEDGFFGSAVALALDDKAALIGASANGGGLGAAWTFTRSGSTWTQQGEKLTPKSGEETEGGGFGNSLALSREGNTALVGASGDNGGFGAAWAFTRSGSTWTQQGEKLTPKSGEETGSIEFGQGVALSADGNSAMIGASGDREGVGAAWAFTRSGSTWTQLGEKLAAKGEEEIGNGAFGFSVALSSQADTALIGAPFDNGGTGAGWVFSNPPTATVSLANTTIQVDRDGEAAIDLSCTGSAKACAGSLTLTAESAIGIGKKKRSIAVTIGTISGLIPSGKTTTVELRLNALGRALLLAGRGNLPGRLTILKSSPAPSEEQTYAVELVQQKSSR